jgi:DNA-binding response OmpR family regulator
MARILSVSYDKTLLHTRRLVLEARGYSVASGFGFKESMFACKQGGLDLFILGHSIPEPDKQALIKTFREFCSGAIVSLQKANESDVFRCQFLHRPGPENRAEPCHENPHHAVNER